MALKKHTRWSGNVRPLFLPLDCPMVTTCAVEIMMELTLHTCAKAVVIAIYLPHLVEEHDRVCQAIARLSISLPHHLVLDSDFRGGWTCSTPKDSHVQTLPFKTRTRAPTLMFTPH
jgi:hypothetical protein